MNRKLVAYFSPTGTTAAAAKTLAEAAGADLYEIRPKVPYTREDLNWMNEKARSTIEMKDPAGRPELADRNAGVEVYDTVFLGFPIWWYIAPTIINTFLEQYDFSGKTVVLFATSGGRSFGGAAPSAQRPRRKNCRRPPAERSSRQREAGSLGRQPEAVIKRKNTEQPLFAQKRANNGCSLCLKSWLMA